MSDRYATPSLRSSRHYPQVWYVSAHPWGGNVGSARKFPSGWTATTERGQYAGLWPTLQAAAEVLVKQAGYELEMS